MVLVLGNDLFRSCNLSLVSIVNHFVNDCTNSEFLPLYLASSITSFLFLTFVSCHAGIFSSFPILFQLLPLHLNQHAWGARSFAHALDFPRLASLRDRPPESSEPHVTLDFTRFAEQNNIGVNTPSFPGPHLTGLLRLLEELCPTDTLCRETKQSCACSHLQRKIK